MIYGKWYNTPHVYQLREYIKSFQREMSFPKPQRGDMFIETEKPKYKAPAERYMKKLLFKLSLYVAPIGAKYLFVVFFYKYNAAL